MVRRPSGSFGARRFPRECLSLHSTTITSEPDDSPRTSPAPGTFDGQGAAERDGLHAAHLARQLDADVADLDRREVGRVLVPGAVDQMDQRSALRRLLHQRHLDQRVGVGTELASARQQPIDHVGHKTAMGLRAVTVVETTDVPRDVGGTAAPVIHEDETRHCRLDFVAPDLFRRTEHRRRIR